MHHDIVIVKGIFVHPDGAVDLLFGKNLSRVLGKKQKQIKLLCRQFQGQTVFADLAR